MKAERKTESTLWMSTSEDYILRSACNAAIRIGGTDADPVLAGDAAVTDEDILSYVQTNSDENDDTKGVQINAVLVRIIPDTSPI